MTTSAKPTQEMKIPAGFKTLLEGPAGTGKTYAIGELAETGLEVFYLALENGLESLLGYYSDNRKPIPPNLHWHILDAPSASFEELIKMAEDINKLSYESLTKINDPNRMKHNQFITLLKVLNGFIDHRTGQSFGPVTSWGTDKCLVIDGLTGINRAAMSLVIGAKPAKNQADWGIAQDTVEKLLRQLCDNCPCHFVLIAHVERETDAILGGSKISVSTLGKALAPKIPPMFSDVILTVREGTSWTWDTGNSQADVKARNIPFQAKQKPSFKLLYERWKSRVTAV